MLPIYLNERVRNSFHVCTAVHSRIAFLASAIAAAYPEIQTVEPNWIPHTTPTIQNHREPRWDAAFWTAAAALFAPNLVAAGCPCALVLW